MEKYSFFDAVTTDAGAYDRTYKASDIAAYFASFIGNGVYANPTSNLQVVSANDGMKVKVKAGKAWINGYFYQLTEDKTLQLSNADATNGRIDTVVIRLDYTNRLMKVMAVTGNTAIMPVATALQRDADAYDIKLCDIAVGKGVSAIGDVDITDKRMDNTVCGVVSGVVDQIDTTNLFNQYDTAFDTWFEAMKGQLTTDAAGNLQTELNTETTRAKAVEGTLTDLITTEKGNLVGAINENKQSIVLLSQNLTKCYEALFSNAKAIWGGTILNYTQERFLINSYENFSNGWNNSLIVKISGKYEVAITIRTSQSGLGATASLLNDAGVLCTLQNQNLSDITKTFEVNLTAGDVLYTSNVATELSFYSIATIIVTKIN